MSRFALLIFLMQVMAGCGGDKLPRVQVSGKATLDGQPIPLAQVSFVALPDDISSIRPQSVGRIKDGIFQFRPDLGPLPGQQQAWIVLLKETVAPPDPSSAHPQPDTQLQEVGSFTVPVEIPEAGTTELLFDLHSKDLKAR